MEWPAEAGGLVKYVKKADLSNRVRLSRAVEALADGHQNRRTGKAQSAW